MRISTYPLRFFHIVTPAPSLMGWTFLIAVVAGGATIAAHPERSERALLPVLLLQLFAASSGFDGPARRGHYDLLLTTGDSRVWMALLHWARSCAPGVASWLVLAIVEMSVTKRAGMLLTSGTLLALLLVSTLSWAVSVRLPRFSGAIGWLLVLTIALSSWPQLRVHEAESAVALLEQAWKVLVYPPLLVGHSLGPADVATAVPAIVLALSSMGGACRWVSRARFPLEAAQ